MMKKTYSFSEAVNEELEGFKSYLKRRRMAADTIRQHSNYTGIFLEWLEAGKMEPEQVLYKDVLDFIEHLKEEVSSNQIRRIILSLKHYYSHLNVPNNPVVGINLRGKKKSILKGIVAKEQLYQLYEQYKVIDDRTMRNKVLLGLMIYEAVTTRELHQLEPGHVDFERCKITIPGSKISNRRILEIHADQLLDLQDYVLEVRSRMLSNLRGKRAGRKASKIDERIYERLFFSESGSADIKTSLHHLFRKVKQIDPAITSGKVIRASVIAEWLRDKDIRVVQYMAGHRYVSSTEKYDVHRLERLKDSMMRYHPLK